MHIQNEIAQLVREVGLQLTSYEDAMDQISNLLNVKSNIKMKIAYIAHPIGGDVDNNLGRVLKICLGINLTEPDVVPFAPYVSDCFALDDDNPDERKRGLRNSVALLEAGFVDEIRLYGNKISKGMEMEIKIAHQLGIPVVAMTRETKVNLESLVALKNKEKEVIS